MIFSENAAKIFRVWTPLFHERFPLILFWSMKSGCTSLHNWFYFQLGLLREAESFGGVHTYTFYHYVRQDDYKKRLMEQLLSGKKDCYKLVRNPYRRAVSSFLQVCSSQIYECQKIKKFLYNDENSDMGISFKQFLYYVNNIGTSIDLIDPHCLPQYVDGEEEIVRNYIYLENFNHEINIIEKKYGLFESDPSLLTSLHHHFPRMSVKGDFSEVKFTIGELLNKPLPTYESFYDKETKDLVRHIYQKDFEVYGYSY